MAGNEWAAAVAAAAAAAAAVARAATAGRVPRVDAAARGAAVAAAAADGVRESALLRRAERGVLLPARLPHGSQVLKKRGHVAPRERAAVMQMLPLRIVLAKHAGELASAELTGA